MRRFVCLSLLLGACTPAPAVPPAAPAGPRRYVETAGGGSVSGQVALQNAIPYFGDNAAARAYGLLAMPVGKALVTLSTLEEEVFAHGGKPIVAASDAQGRYRIDGLAPTDQPFVINALLARDHRLSAIALPGQAEVPLDEASSQIAETLRWQLRPAAAALKAEALAGLRTHTLATLEPLPPRGEIPEVAALKAGAGHLLRNGYVGSFGARVSPDATALSDAWKALLGFRPLALTFEVAGQTAALLPPDDPTGEDDAGPDAAPAAPDGVAAGQAVLGAPTSVAFDPAGNLYIADHNARLLRLLPAADRGPLLRWKSAMKAGRVYAIAGIANGPSARDAYNGVFQAAEQASVANPDAAPEVANDFPLLHPQRLLLDPAGHMFFTSDVGWRVFLIPATDFERYGRRFKANRLYAVAGNGRTSIRGPQIEADNPATSANEQRFRYNLGDGAPAYGAALHAPTGLARDAQGNLFILDSAQYNAGTYSQDDPAATLVQPAEGGRKSLIYHASIRVVRAGDGKIFTLKLTLDGQPFSLDGAQDLRLEGGALYVAHTKRHVIVRVPLPAEIPGTAEAQVVLGKLDTPGWVEGDYPDVYGVNEGLPRGRALLDGPVSLAFDAGGHLLVADRRRLRVLAPDDQVYTLGGAFDTAYLSGDARLCAFNASGFLERDPATGDFLLPDKRDNVIRRLWARRGLL